MLVQLNTTMMANSTRILNHAGNVKGKSLTAATTMMTMYKNGMFCHTSTARCPARSTQPPK